MVTMKKICRWEVAVLVLPFRFRVSGRSPLGIGLMGRFMGRTGYFHVAAPGLCVGMTFGLPPQRLLRIFFCFGLQLTVKQNLERQNQSFRCQLH